VVGRGNAAHAGDRTLDVDAPAFRGASLVGAIVAGLLLVFVGWLMVSRDRAHAHARRAPTEPEDATAAPAEQPPAED